MAGLIHLVKLSVGSEGVEDLRAWQATKRAQAEDGAPRHVTRMWPKREADLLKGGSIYWVIKGQLQCRQKILRLDEIYREDGIRRCAIVLDPRDYPHPFGAKAPLPRMALFKTRAGASRFAWQPSRRRGFARRIGGGFGRYRSVLKLQAGFQCL